MSEKKCVICSQTFNVHEHHQGFVVDDHMFICEHCSEDKTHQHLHEQLQTTMSLSEESNIMPISLWLISEHNKNFQPLTRKF